MNIFDRMFDPGVAGDKSVIRFLLLLSGVPILTVAGFWLVNARADASPSIAPDAVMAALAKRLPKTEVSSIDCKKLPGVCEVAAGSTLFYTDPAARYLIIGRVYDMETRTDLTATRLLELNPDVLVNGAARQGGSSGPSAANGQPDGPRAGPAVARNVPLSQLPSKGAIPWGPTTGPKVTVFSDFRCSYCSQLSATLQQMGARVEERPISVLGSRQLSEAVYCSKSPVSALHAAYAGETPQSPKCDTSGLDANEAFARKHGFNGTPVIVRADGAVLEGFRPAPILTAWLKGGPAA
jgi:thiol:disulfide interchange protein DsbC